MRKAALYILAAVLSVPASDLAAQFDREWKIFIVPFSHVDVGFTAPVPTVIDQQSRYIDTAIDFVEQTAAFPEHSRFRWSTEITWPLENYLATRSPEQIERLMDHVRAGSIEIGAMHFGLQTDLAGPEELVRSLYLSQEIERRFGVDNRTAVINDTPGFTWSLAQLLDKAEIPYLSVAMNSFLSNFFETTDLPHLFYWEAQSGDRTLVWRSIHTRWAYLEGIVWGVYGAYGIMQQRLTNLLTSMADNGYPYDFVLINAATGDNGAPIVSISNNAREWNNRRSDSEIRVSTFAEFFDYVQSTGSDIPVFRGDAPNWWSWSFAASATGGFFRSREAQTALPAAETAASIASALQPGYPYPSASLRRGYINNLLFEDHNLGAASNLPPENAVAFWERKMAWVNAAADTAHSIKSSALDAWASVIGSTDPTSVVVFNLTPWSRSDVAALTSTQIATAGLEDLLIIDVASGLPAEQQMLGSGSVVFVADSVPPFGFRRYRIESGGPLPAQRGLTGPVVENDHYRVSVDQATGGLTGMLDKELNIELATGNGRFAQYTLNGSGLPQMNVAESDSGSVLQRMVLRGDAPGSSTYETEFVLPAFEKRLDVTATWVKNPPSGVENVDFVFDFGLPDATLRYEIPFGNVQAFEDELAGFRSNHYGWLRWSEIGSTIATAVLATRGAGVHAYSSGSFEGRVRLLTSFNNLDTAYRAGIGQLSAAFSITSRPAGHEPSASTRYSYRYNHPLETRIIHSSSGRMTEPSYSFLGFGSSDVFVSTLKRADDGNGFILRLFNPAPESVTLALESGPEMISVAETTLLEEDLTISGRSGSTHELRLEPFEVRTLRLNLSVPSSVELSPERSARRLVGAVYPNPVFSETTIPYGIQHRGRVEIDVLDVLGRRVDTILNADHRPGQYLVNWRPSSALANGVYVAVLRSHLLSGDVLTDFVTITLAR